MRLFANVLGELKILRFLSNQAKSISDMNLSGNNYTRSPKASKTLLSEGYTIGILSVSQGP